MRKPAGRLGYSGRAQQETIYCYSESRATPLRLSWAASLRSRASKGWGEISPNEFKQFIGKEMRLRCFRTGKGGITPKVDSQQILSFYMGKNTPERKDYIMENLVVTVEE
jgi:topoisomerase IV subunit B